MRLSYSMQPELKMALMEIEEQSSEPPIRHQPTRASSGACFCLRQRLHVTSPAVGAFINGTALYILSREWQDLIATNLFRLHPLPFCRAGSSWLPCTPEASASVQARFAVGMLVAGAVVQHVALRNESRWPSLGMMPPMVGMCVGWSWGFAGLKALAEAEEALGGVMQPWLLALIVSASATLCSAVLILAFNPATLCSTGSGSGARGGGGGGGGIGSSAGGGGPRRRLLSERRVGHLQELWPLWSRALSVLVMMLWTTSLSSLLVEGVPVAQQHGALYRRMLFFHAAALTAACSLANVHLARRRHAAMRDMRRAEEAAASSAGPSSAAAAGQLHRLVRARHVAREATLVHVLSLLEQSLEYIVGMAWTNFVVSITSLGLFPTLTVTALDAAVALGLTLLGLSWLVLTGSSAAAPAAPAAGTGTAASSSPAADESSRSDVEVHYLTNAMGFFSGFAWISLLRDLATLVASLGAARGEAWAHGSELLCVFVFGPVLTYVLVRGLGRHRRAAPRRAATDGPDDGSSVAGQAWRALLARAGLSAGHSLPGSPHGVTPAAWSELEPSHDYELDDT